ncbi:MAG: hypothetical protein V1834_03835 [Candidatus Micrarchaeota archaeon]
MFEGDPKKQKFALAIIALLMMVFSCIVLSFLFRELQGPCIFVYLGVVGVLGWGLYDAFKHTSKGGEIVPELPPAPKTQPQQAKKVKTDAKQLVKEVRKDEEKTRQKTQPEKIEKEKQEQKAQPQETKQKKKPGGKQSRKPPRYDFFPLEEWGDLRQYDKHYVK